MNYGFLIRNDRCIGCHACSTACKSENDVPVGVNRTWVKNVEKGLYPDVRRSFQVTRCNHCANPPCVRICPVTAMYKRADGIVEFDPDRCIGCKACLQACPYDAIYVDPDTGTAAKCHFCAHRVDVGLEPACVVVCPEHAIISGDMDDASSELSRMLAKFDVTVRKPEQGTAPQLFYVDGEDAALTPTATEAGTEGFAWAEGPPSDGRAVTTDRGGIGRKRSASGESIRPPGRQGEPATGPIHIGGGSMAGEMVRTFYNARHHAPWHWPVPAYLVTKGIGAGVFLLMALGTLTGMVPFQTGEALVLGFLSLLFVGITTGLLVYDLERPERFLSVVMRPQWSSWLTRGAYLLIGFTLLVGAWWILELGASSSWWGPEIVGVVRTPVLWVGGLLAMGVAAYTAFLFGQAEGRDLWQSPLLPLHLLVQAALAGAAMLLWIEPVFQAGPELAALVRTTFLTALVVDLLFIVLGEFGMPHASADAARAAHDITHGRYSTMYRWGVLVLGHLVPFVAVLLGGPAVGSLGAMAALVGLYFFEYAFVMAPQRIPNS